MRSYEDKAVEKKLLQVLEAARVAPSAINYHVKKVLLLDITLRKRNKKICIKKILCV